MIFILKKDGSQQTYVYYHALNEVIAENKYSLHRIGGLFDQLHVVCVCSLRSIFDRDRNSQRY
jgi:hypothetical protein